MLCCSYFLLQAAIPAVRLGLFLLSDIFLANFDKHELVRHVLIIRLDADEYERNIAFGKGIIDHHFTRNNPALLFCNLRSSEMLLKFRQYVLNLGILAHYATPIL